MPPKRSSTSATPAMNQDAIRQLIANITAALEAQAAAMCAEEDRVTFATGTLTDDAMSWWNTYAQPIGIVQANQITWTELKRLLTNKYCPRTEVKKCSRIFYNLVVKGNDLKTYNRRFQELAVLCPNMVPNAKKLMEVFISGLPKSIEGNVTASKPQTLEEAINIAQRLASAAIFVKMGVLQIGISAMVIENKVVTVMSSSPHSTIVPSDSDTEDAFSSMNILNYFPASPGNISPNSSDDFTKYLLDILFFPPLHDNPYVQTYDAIPPPQVIMALPAIVPPQMFDSQDFYPPKNISSPKDTETPVESTTQVSLSSSMESSSPIRSTTSPPDYLFDEFIFAELDNSLWIISLNIPNCQRKFNNYTPLTYPPKSNSYTSTFVNPLCG
ncbi:reverse transcriptase domain-containing protein [Tanacetum coccineum]